MVVLNHDGRCLTLQLEDRCDASVALAMREALVRAELSQVETVQIDASDVVKIDLAILQVLLAWCNFLDSHQISWQWRGLSDSFRQAVVHVGLVQAFRLVNGQSN